MGDQDHAPRRTRRRPLLVRWLPEILVVLLLAAAVSNAEFDLAHRWFGLPAARPDRPVDAGGRPLRSLDLTALPAALTRPAGAVVASTPGPPPDPAKIRAALAAYVSAAGLGPRVAVWVSDPATGRILYRHGSGPVTPASTLKLLTTTAALQKLGPQARFRTSTVLSGSRVVLVGGGDPYLASTPRVARTDYLGGADLRTLAARTAAALRARGLDRVRLGYDTSLFSGPAVAPTWPPGYLTGGVVPPITALWADEGSDGHDGYLADPAAAAASAFAADLRRLGIGVPRILGEVGASAPAGGAEPLAAVQSPTLAQIVEQTLLVSDNNAAEVIARQLGLAVGGPGSFAGGVAAVRTVLGRLGVDLTGTVFSDGSGLARSDRVLPSALLQVLRLATAPTRPQFSPVLTGLPVAGFDGSLADRFEAGPVQAKGRVRAKTGTLTGISALAGVVNDLGGTRMLFVAIADRVPATGTMSARHDLEQIAAALGACHCGSAS